jgi:hypothetical protein
VPNYEINSYFDASVAGRRATRGTRKLFLKKMGFDVLMAVRM